MRFRKINLMSHFHRNLIVFSQEIRKINLMSHLYRNLKIVFSQENVQIAKLFVDGFLGIFRRQNLPQTI